MNNEEQIELMKINDKTYMIIDKIDIYIIRMNPDNSFLINGLNDVTTTIKRIT